MNNAIVENIWEMRGDRCSGIESIGWGSVHPACSRVQEDQTVRLVATSEGDANMALFIEGILLGRGVVAA